MIYLEEIYKEAFTLLVDSSAWGCENDNSAKEVYAYINGVADMTNAVLKIINRKSNDTEDK